jgi:hypothetical protein
MSCRHPWDREFMDASLGSAWVNGEYKRHRETILLDRERALLPATQDRLGTYREYRNLVEELPAKKTRAREMRRELRALDVEISGDVLTAARLKERTFAANPRPRPADAPPLKKVVRGCPAEACRGFLTSDFLCGACDRAFCRTCHEELGDGHACDPDAAKAAAFLIKDTKPCPTCAAPIHKIGGCSQVRALCYPNHASWPCFACVTFDVFGVLLCVGVHMWCTVCRTAFDWRTGEVDRGPVHNPHYVAWANTRGGAREDGGGGCDGGWADVSRRLHVAGMDRDTLARVGEMHRRATHLQRVVVPTLPGDGELDNLDLRLAYLNREITEDHLRLTVQRREKKRAKLLAVRQILEMYVAATADVVATAGLRVMTELKELRALTDSRLADVGKRFAMKVPALQDYEKQQRQCRQYDFFQRGY